MLRRACRRQILPALLLGAATTVLVGWSITYWPPSKTSTFYWAAGPIWIAEGPDGVRGLTACHDAAADLYSSTSISRTVDYQVLPEFVESEKIAPAWILQRLSIPKHRAECDHLLIVQGWPFRSLWCMSTWTRATAADGTYTSQSQTKGAIATPDRKLQARGISFNRLLPLIPTPPGFAADTALFASAWWLLLFLPPTARRYLRRRRNLCPACAYNLQGLPPHSACPECGRA